MIVTWLWAVVYGIGIAYIVFAAVRLGNRAVSLYKNGKKDEYAFELRETAKLVGVIMVTLTLLYIGNTVDAAYMELQARGCEAVIENMTRSCSIDQPVTDFPINKS